LLINTLLKAELIEKGILELGPIVTTNSFQAVEMLIVQSQSQALKVLKYFIFCFSVRKPNSNESSHQPMARTYHLLPMERT
jgi:hypothetical protein